MPGEKKTNKGRVVAVPVDNDDKVVKLGDVVMFHEFSGDKLTIDSSEFKVLALSDLLVKEVK
jgi:co-chaperonin GroES (HSP10)